MISFACVCLLVCVWRWTVDLGVLSEFPFGGSAARWQTWMATAVVVGAFAWTVLGGADLKASRRTSRG